MFFSLGYRTPTKSKLLHREVVRLVTPGTLLEPLNSDANYLMSIAQGPDSSLGLAWLDLSTGEFYLGVSSIENLEEDLSRVNPAEVGVKYFAYTTQKDAHNCVDTGACMSARTSLTVYCKTTIRFSAYTYMCRFSACYCEDTIFKKKRKHDTDTCRYEKTKTSLQKKGTYTPTCWKQVHCTVPLTLGAEVHRVKELLQVNITKFTTQNFGIRGKC